MKNAFTLIELIVVIAIIGIFSGMGLAAYNNFTDTKNLETETQKLLDILELAKKKASAGDMDAFSCFTFDGYRVTINTNNYTMFLVCKDAVGNEIPNLIKTYSFNKGITNNPTAGVINFKPLSGTSTDKTIILKNIKNQTKTITITGGSINILQ